MPIQVSVTKTDEGYKIVVQSAREVLRTYEVPRETLLGHLGFEIDLLTKALA